MSTLERPVASLGTGAGIPTANEPAAQLGPKREPGSPDGLTQAEAEAELRRLMHNARAAQDRAALTVAVVGERLLRHLEIVGRKPTTLATYRSALETHLLPALGTLPLVEVRPGADPLGRRDCPYTSRCARQNGRAGAAGQVRSPGSWLPCRTPASLPSSSRRAPYPNRLSTSVSSTKRSSRRYSRPSTLHVSRLVTSIERCS